MSDAAQAHSLREQFNTARQTAWLRTAFVLAFLAVDFCEILCVTDAKTNLVNYDMKFVIVKHYEFNNGEDPNKYVPTTPTVTPAPAPPPPAPKPLPSIPM